MTARLEDLFERIVELRDWQTLEPTERNAVSKPSSAERAQLQSLLDEAAHSGELLKRGVRFTSAMVSIAGAVVGFGSVAALTAGDGRTPINLVWLIALTMVFPLLTVSVSFTLSLLMRGSLAGGIWSDLLLSFLRSGIRLAARALDPADKKSTLRLQSALGVVRGDYALLQPVLPWALLKLSQRFALCLSLGFIAALLLRLAGLDLSFGWFTTVDAISTNMHTMVRMLGAPFGWMSVELVPSEELIEATRFSRFSGTFAGGASAATASGAWWPFLMAGAVCWGVLPRLAMLIWARWQEGRAVQKVLDSTEALRMLDLRLRGERGALGVTHAVKQRGRTRTTSNRNSEALQPEKESRMKPRFNETTFVADAPEPGGNAKEMLAKAAAKQPRVASASTMAARPDVAPLRAVYLYWEQDHAVPHAVRDALNARLNLLPELEELWGNDADHDQENLEAIARMKPDVVVVFVEPFANPGKGFSRQYKDLRAVVGARTPIVVSMGWYDAAGALQPAEARQIEVWTQSLQVYGDPALRILDATEPASAVKST